MEQTSIYKHYEMKYIFEKFVQIFGKYSLCPSSRIIKKQEHRILLLLNKLELLEFHANNKTPRIKKIFTFS